MSSNRPFLSNFLAAFRAHSSALPKPSTSLSTPTAPAAWTATAAYSVTSPTQTAQISTLSAPRSISSAHKHARPRSTSPHAPFSPPPLPQHTGPRTGRPTSVVEKHQQQQQHSSPAQAGEKRAPQSNATATAGATQAVTIPLSPQNRRRGSDSSSEGGFRDVAGRGGEKWYIGGRTAGGEERYYKLCMVRRERSEDRLSADRMSL